MPAALRALATTSARSFVRTRLRSSVAGDGDVGLGVGLEDLDKVVHLVGLGVADDALVDLEVDVLEVESLGAADGWVRIAVRDHGPGIPAGELPHVKEKFYKGSGKERGSGIGLAVCEEIVTRHGGRLTIENAPDGGVLATVLLPLNGTIQ